MKYGSVAADPREQICWPTVRPDAVHMHQRRIVLLFMDVTDQGDAKLAEVAFASGGACGSLCRCERREQQGSENGNDRDHNQ